MRKRFLALVALLCAFALGGVLLPVRTIAQQYLTVIQGPPGQWTQPWPMQIVPRLLDLVQGNATYTLQSLNQCTPGINATGYNSTALYVSTGGTMVGTLTVQSTWDTVGSSGYTATTITNAGIPSTGGTVALTNPNTVTSYDIPPIGGITYYRVCVTAYTSGTALIRLRASDNRSVFSDVVTTLFSAGTPLWGVSVGGIAAAKAPVASLFTALSFTPAGALRTSKEPNTAATYRACKTQLTVAATPTDIFTMAGSGTKTVRVTRVEINGIATVTAVTIQVYLHLHSGADTGGTSAAMTIIPLDASDAAGTTSPKSWTVNPTIGADLGTISAATLYVPTAATATASGNGAVWTFGDFYQKAITLAGVAPEISLNLNGATITGGGVFNACFEWIEY